MQLDRIWEIQDLLVNQDTKLRLNNASMFSLHQFTFNPSFCGQNLKTCQSVKG